ncbi:cytochrome P450, partial [Cunninghamella echinulata]
MSGLTTSLIVALNGASDIEKEGQVIRFGNGANLDTIRGLAAEKLAINGNTQELILLDGKGDVLNGIDDVRQQQVVYVDLPQKIIETIPGPTKLPFVGNLYDLLPNITFGWMKLFDRYGPLVDASLLGKRIIGTNDPVIAEIFTKEGEYFTKKIAPTFLSEVKEFGGSGLFTSDSDAHEWKLAHKLLMPAFSPRAIKAYQEEMGIITQKTIKLLEEYKPTDQVEILDWTTKLTFETIGDIGFGYDFGLLDKVDAPNHPMIDAMSDLLKITVTRCQQAQFMKRLPTSNNRKFNNAIQVLYKTVTEVIEKRKSSADANGPNRDMLDFMLNARDEANEGLTDINIRDQIITFLIAGHDTTANTLAWALYEINRHPDVQARLLQEIANAGITHDKLPTVEQISNLKYMHQVIKETLRLYSPVRDLDKYCKKTCIVPGGYKIPAGTGVSVNVYAMHYNPDIYPDPERFDPDRFSPEEEQKRSRFAWLPFSTGPRACIGMAFALQEAKTVLSMFLHKFEFCHDGSKVEFDCNTATTKPDNLLMTIHPRTNFPEPNENAVPLSSTKDQANAPPPRSLPQLTKEQADKKVELPPIAFVYGTQTGTSQDYANQLAQQARGFGFTKVVILEMDKLELLDTGKYEGASTGKLRELVVLVTATYNGQPPDSAERFD